MLRWATAGRSLAATRAAAPGRSHCAGSAVRRHFPDTVWVCDLTCIRTYEGWRYLAAVSPLQSSSGTTHKRGGLTVYGSLGDSGRVRKDRRARYDENSSPGAGSRNV